MWNGWNIQHSQFSVCLAAPPKYTTKQTLTFPIKRKNLPTACDIDCNGQQTVPNHHQVNDTHYNTRPHTTGRNWPDSGQIWNNNYFNQPWTHRRVDITAVNTLPLAKKEIHAEASGEIQSKHRSMILTALVLKSSAQSHTCIVASIGIEFQLSWVFDKPAFDW